MNKKDIKDDLKKETKKETKKKKDTELETLLNEKLEYIKTLEDQNLRTKAEMVNYRTRKDGEVSRMLKYANEDIIKEIISIVDDFERALKMDKFLENSEGSKFLDGFKLVYSQLVTTLTKYGVKTINGNKKPFDPTYHQAVITEHVDGVDEGMVLDVLQKGYLLKDKVIRHAMVKVSE
jgi:molecular chaperone GrpE